MRLRSLLLLPALGTTVAVSAAAQPSASPLIGHWEVELEVGRRVENEVVTPIRAKATLRIVAKGDSLSATIQMPARPDGTVPAPTTATGPRNGNETIFVQSLEAKLNINGEVSTVPTKVTWVLKADGDAMSGTVLREIPSMSFPAEPGPLTGKRLKDGG